MRNRASEELSLSELKQKPTPIRLGDVAEVFVGYPFRSETFATEGVKLLRGDNISQGHIEWTDAVKLPFEFASDFSAFGLGEGDVVLAMDRPWVGAGLKFASVRKQDAGALLVQRTARLRGVGGNKTEFLRYVIASPAFTKYIKGVTTGSLVPHISKEQIQDFLFFLPAASTQQKIATALSTLDAKIDLNHRINAELEALAKTIYDYWFVQFDFPDAHGRPYKSSGGAMVWNDTLKREIPAGWEVVVIEQACETVLGGNAKYKESRLLGLRRHSVAQLRRNRKLPCRDFRTEDHGCRHPRFCGKIAAGRNRGRFHRSLHPPVDSRHRSGNEPIGRGHPRNGTIPVFVLISGGVP